MDPVLALEVAAMSRVRRIAEAEAARRSPAQRAYGGAAAFVTGVSGFLGKHLVEKLLRSTDIRKIYVLLRQKKGKTVKERMGDILQDPVFDRLRQREPQFHDRLKTVEGDITLLELGISREDRELLRQEVNFIFHAAATTRFDEPLARATITNVRGTREVLALGRDCRDLRAFIHVSTAYSHATASRRNKKVCEEFYDMPVDPEELIDMAEREDCKSLDEVTELKMKDWPNTYCFTKAAAEEVVRRMRGSMRVSIVRPAIVISAYREPAPGWVDISATYGPAGIMLGIGLGLIHTMLADRAVHIDVVPVDLVNNALVAAGWATATGPEEQELAIYTVSSGRNSTTWGACGDVQRTDGRKIPTPKAVWYCYSFDASNRLVFNLLFWLLHYIPAYIIDGACMLLGKPRQFVRLYSKAYKLFILNSYFTTSEWKFSDKNLQLLNERMSPRDRMIYDFDVTTIDWKEFMLIWSLGLRKYILKDGLTGTNYAIKKQFWLQIANAVVLVLYAYAWWKIFSFVFSGVMCLF